MKNMNPVQSKFKEVVKELGNLRQRKNATAAELASQFGMSRTQMYTLLQGKLYRKNGKREFSDAVILRLYNEIMLQSKPVEIGSFSFLQNVAKICKQDARMICITGHAGIGKSTALKYLANTEQGVYYTLCDHLDNTESFMERIHAGFGLKKLELRGKKKRKAMIEEIAEFVMRQEQTPLVVLDDIHHLGVVVYQDLKLLFDRTEGMLGIMLVGTPLLERKLKRWAGLDMDENPKYKPRDIMPELYRRFKGRFHVIKPISDVDLAKICEAKGVETKQAKKIAKYYIQLAYLELGMFVESVSKAQNICKQVNEPISEVIKQL